MLPINNYYLTNNDAYYYSNDRISDADSSFHPHSFSSYSQHPLYSNSYEGKDNTSKALTMAALLQACALGIQKISKVLSQKLMAGKEYTSSENVHKVAEYMKNKNNLKVDVHYINDANKNTIANLYDLGNSLNVVARGENAFYVDKLHISNQARSMGLNSKIAVAPHNKPSLILHELGHGINATKWFTKLLQKARPFAYSVPTAMLLASKIAGSNEDGKGNFVTRNAGVLGFCASLPTIIEEAIASYRGIKAAKIANLKGITKGPINLSLLKRNYALALGTYILGGIGLGIASKLTVLEHNSKL